MQRRILASPYGPMYRLARRLAHGTQSTYDVATAIQHYLLANYTYGEQPPVRRYPLESFLFVDRFGYCQQFSGAMALMLRMDGIPARVAAGFLPGARAGASGAFNVRAVDAHSWVEVFFTGIGWVPFNPTPPRSVGPCRSARCTRARARSTRCTPSPRPLASCRRLPRRSARGAATTERVAARSTAGCR